MTTPTSPWNIPLFAPGDTIPSLEGVLNSISTGLNTALNTLNVGAFTRSATYAGLPSTGNSVNQHATVYADTNSYKNGDYVWSGSAWIAAADGLVPITPTSVVGCTIAPSGGIVLTNSTTFSLNGIFTPQYDNYLIKLDISASSAAPAGGTMRMRAGGVDAVTADYNMQQEWVQGNSFTGQGVATQTSWGFTPVAGAEQSAEVQFYAPALARPTRVKIDSQIVISPILMYNTRTQGRHSLSTAYDGFTYIPSVGNVTGTLRVYGFRN